MYVLNSIAFLTIYIREWNTFESLWIYFGPLKSVVIFRKNKKSRSEIENKMTSQRLILMKSCHFYQL